MGFKIFKIHIPTLLLEELLRALFVVGVFTSFHAACEHLFPHDDWHEYVDDKRC